MPQHGEPDPAAENAEAALSGAMTPAGHRTWARVYFADTDFSGVVYHARYLEFLERGRSDFLRLAGVEHSALASGVSGEKVAWVVRRMELQFLKPARIDDVLTIDTQTEKMSGARVFMHQRIRRDGTTLVEAHVEVAVIGLDGRPRRLPREWIDAFLPAGAAS